MSFNSNDRKVGDQIPLSIIVCTHNRVKLLSKCIEYIRHSSIFVKKKLELLIVANACTDDTINTVNKSKAKFCANIDIQTIEVPILGKSFALNAAIKRASGDALCFIDDDQFVEPDFLSEVLLSLINFPNADILCGILLPAWDGTEPQWVHETGKYKIPIRPFPEYHFGSTTKQIQADNRLPSGGNIIVRASLFSKVGTFSTDHGPRGRSLAGGEDHEFLRRALKYDTIIQYVPTIKQFHAIDTERMSVWSMIRKAYFRTRDSVIVSAYQAKLGFFMIHKIIFCIISLFRCKSFVCLLYFLLRIVSIAGEISGILKGKQK